MIPHVNNLAITFVMAGVVGVIVVAIFSMLADLVVGSRRAAHDVCQDCGSNDLRQLHHDASWSRCKSCYTLQSPRTIR